MTEDINLKPIQQAVDQWINKTAKGYYSPLTNMAILTEEVGEVARLIARIHGDQSFKNPNDAKNANEALADELSDVLFVVTCLANQNNIDLNDAFEKGMTKRNTRDKNRHQLKTK